MNINFLFVYFCFFSCLDYGLNLIKNCVDFLRTVPDNQWFLNDLDKITQIIPKNEKE